MLHLRAGEHLDALALELAATLQHPLPDPMTPEWIVVGGAGMDRWLRLALARHLGTSGPGAADGVAANLDLLYPGRLQARVLDAAGGNADADDDPWHVDRLPWAVLDVVHTHPDDPGLGALTTATPGATRWSRARHVADLFDRYLTHRPAMVRRWVDGDDVDGAGRAVSDGASWQPHLFRLVRARIGRPSPAEVLPARLAALRDGDCPDAVPARVSIFGLTTIPNGAPFLELLDALATRRDVDLYLLRPSAGLASHVRAALDDRPPAPPRRADDPLGATIAHPLLRSWARPSRETEALLADRAVDQVTTATAAAPGAGARGTLLSRIQADLRAGTAPDGSFTPDPADRSIRIHSCHGATRQVEVLRDELLHLLAGDATLTEDDIVVMCPAIEDVAPFVEAVLGPSASADAADRGDSGPPALRYRIADRSLRDLSALFAALGALVQLLGSRASAPALMDIASLPPVRARFGFDDDALATIADWVETTDVRWGFDGEHRARWGLPAACTGGSWRHALDRLLTGIAVSDDADLPLAAGGVLPHGIEGGDIGIAGRFADLVARLRRLVDEAAAPRRAAGWAALLARAADDLFAVDPTTRWQQLRLDDLLGGIARAATIDGVEVPVELDLADVARLLAGALQAGGAAPQFFRGGITITSLTPLRGVPYRVVCLLGMDDAAFATGGIDGDDLTALAPHIGDADRRSEQRQALLESLLAAGDHLVVLRSGHSVLTNLPVPPAVPVAELRDTIAATLAPEVRDEVLARIEIAHPRQGFDERNFLPGLAEDGPWSFDPVALDGARARTVRQGSSRAFLEAPLDVPEAAVIDLVELRDFLDHPVRHFLIRTLGITIPQAPERDGRRNLRRDGGGITTTPAAVDGRDLLIELDSLQRWTLKDGLLRHLLAGGDPEDFARRHRAAGSLPPGRLGEAALRRAADDMAPVIEAVRDRGVTRLEPAWIPVDVSLRDGTRIVGSVPDAGGDHRGPLRAYASKLNGKRRLAAWLDLLVLVADDPASDARSVLIGQTSNAAGVEVEELAIRGDDPDERARRALDALDVVVDCYRRGRREPLPLFPKSSPELHRGKRPGWNAMFGDGDDRWLQTAFGVITEAEMTALPCLAHDPDGPGRGRAERYAHHLWGAYDTSLAAAESGGGPS